MTSFDILRRTLRGLAMAGVCCWAMPASADVPAPAAVLGHSPGDDYYLANYEEEVAYFRRLEASSDRIKLFNAGKTTQGREFVYAVISSPENLRNWDKWKQVSHRLADPRGLTDEEAKALAKDGKIIVHIDGGLHSSEVADHQLPIALAYKLLSAKNDAEVDAILDNVILVLWPTLNPDGQDMVVDWYRKHRDTPYETSDMPWLYQEYVGHDNNRDGYMQNMIESQVITKTGDSYSPVIWYTQHQPAPFPARIWVPPFADPVSTNISPYMRIWTNLIGTEMMARFEKEQKPGAMAMAKFDNWYPGYLDYTRVFRNTISYFTEATHPSPTPKVYDVKYFPKNMQDLRATIMYPHPWKGGLWRLGDTVDYMLTASMSTLETAVKYRETLLYNRYQAGRDTVKHYATQGPFAYVIPAGQPDMNEAGLLMQKMIDNGVEVHQSSTALAFNGKTYPVGSWVILMDQPFAGLAKELFEAQHYPDAILGGDGKPADLPYDVTGWTLSMQMGVTVDPVASAVPAEVRSSLAGLGAVTMPAGSVKGTGPVYALSHKINASFLVMNDVLARGGKVAFSSDPVATANGPETGAVLVSGIDARALDAIVANRKVDAIGMTSAPAGTAVRKARVALYRPWGSNIDEGWTRWNLEQYHFGATSLYNADVKKGSLNAKFDTIILPDITEERRLPPGQRAGKDMAKLITPGPVGSLLEGYDKADEPAPYAGGIGSDGAEALKAFVQQGGTLVAMNNSADAIIDLFNLPVTNALKNVGSDTFFCSGALVQIHLTDGTPATLGMATDPIVMFENSPAFVPDPGFKGKIIASYPETGNPLRSGVLLHPGALAGKAAALEVDYGKGHIYLYGFMPQWRGQAHGAYKLLFNTLYTYPTEAAH